MVLDIANIHKMVINLPERTDRLTKFDKEVYPLGWKYEVMHGIRNEVPMIGIGQAHRKCVMVANNLNIPHVLIMEDDLLLAKSDKLIPYLATIMADVPDDFDILLGGYYTGTKIAIHNENWHKVGQFCGLHFYIVAQKFYQHILNYDGKMHIDRYMNVNHDHNVYCSNKFFAMQHDGFSDNVGKVTDYLKDISPKQLL